MDRSTEVSCGMALGPLQAEFLESRHRPHGGGSEFQNLLFVGPKGCGKRTVGQDLAASFGDGVCPRADG